MYFDGSYIGFTIANLVILVLYFWLFYKTYDRKAVAWNVVHAMAIGCALCVILGSIIAQMQSKLNAIECVLTEHLLTSLYWAAQGLMRSVFAYRITMLHQMQSKQEQAFNSIWFGLWVAIAILIVIWTNLAINAILVKDSRICTFILRQDFLCFVASVPTIFDIVIIIQFVKYLGFFNRCRGKKDGRTGLD